MGDRYKEQTSFLFHFLKMDSCIHCGNTDHASHRDTPIRYIAYPKEALILGADRQVKLERLQPHALPWIQPQQRADHICQIHSDRRLSHPNAGLLCSCFLQTLKLSMLTELHSVNSSLGQGFKNSASNGNRNLH